MIDGILTALKSRPGSKFYGFLEGTVGMFENKHIEITESNFGLYRNQGGYDFLGRSVDKVRTPE